MLLLFPSPSLTSTQNGNYYIMLPFNVTSPGSTQTINPTIVTEFEAGAFKRVWVNNKYVGGVVRVYWELERAFVDPGPYSFQLQYSHSGTPRGDDWVNIGSTTSNFYADDNKSPNGQRMYGKTPTVHYRVILTTSIGYYVSPVANVLGIWNKQEWLMTREIIRQEQLNHKLFSSVRGYLLKARRYGPTCTESKTEHTKEIINSQCEICYGTGFVSGYYPPTEYYGLLNPGSPNRESRSLGAEGGSVGTTKNVVISGRFLAVLPMIQADAWVDADSDERYYIHSVKEAAQWKSVPIIYTVELRLAPFSDVLYKVPINEE
jgi:hypothetical protein